MITEHAYQHDWSRRYYKFDSYKVFPYDFIEIMIKELGEAQLKNILAKYDTDGGFKVACLKGEDLETYWQNMIRTEVLRLRV